MPQELKGKILLRGKKTGGREGGPTGWAEDTRRKDGGEGKRCHLKGAKQNKEKTEEKKDFTYTHNYPKDCRGHQLWRRGRTDGPIHTNTCYHTHKMDHDNRMITLLDTMMTLYGCWFIANNYNKNNNDDNIIPWLDVDWNSGLCKQWRLGSERGSQDGKLVSYLSSGLGLTWASPYPALVQSPDGGSVGLLFLFWLLKMSLLSLSLPLTLLYLTDIFRWSCPGSALFYSFFTCCLTVCVHSQPVLWALLSLTHAVILPKEKASMEEWGLELILGRA